MYYYKMDKITITKEQQDYIDCSYAKHHILSYMEVYGDTSAERAIIKGMENCIEELIEESAYNKHTNKNHHSED